MKPFSDNLIFFDTEFTTLNPTKGELMSIGMVKYTGEEFYVELPYEVADCEPWVVEHVVPHLEGNIMDRDAAKAALAQFIGSHTPYLLAYVNQYDAVYWYKLFGGAKSHPAFWIPLDFASVLFSYGFEPGSMGREEFFREIGVDRSGVREHHALDDARVLAKCYHALVAAMKRKEHH